jgi:hypothetical protein
MNEFAARMFKQKSYKKRAINAAPPRAIVQNAGESAARIFLRFVPDNRNTGTGIIRMIRWSD